MQTPAHQLPVIVDCDDDFVVAGQWRSTSWCGVAEIPELEADCCIHEQNACCAKEKRCRA
jgi:hypothetical protein